VHGIRNTHFETNKKRHTHKDMKTEKCSLTANYHHSLQLRMMYKSWNACYWETTLLFKNAAYTTLPQSQLFLDRKNFNFKTSAMCQLQCRSHNPSVQSSYCSTLWRTTTQLNGNWFNTYKWV